MKDKPAKKTGFKKRPAKQNYPPHNHLKCWDMDNYERGAVEMAVNRLLQGRRFERAANVGGQEYLTTLLRSYTTEVVPSKTNPRQLLPADQLKLRAGSVDLVMFVSVMSHLSNPEAELAGVTRLLNKGGFAIIEVPNSLHATNRLRYLLQGKRTPTAPIDLYSAGGRRTSEIALVAHNPHTVIKQLAHAGLKVESILSVSNLRSPTLKRLIPNRTMLTTEGVMQSLLVNSFFGPNIFILARKA